MPKDILKDFGGCHNWERALIDASFAKAPEGGEETGPNPTHRSKSGSKHRIITDAQGIPQAATVTAANVNEVTEIFEVLADLDPVGGKRGPSGACPNVCKAIAATTPTWYERSCAIWASRRSWPNAAQSMAAVWECIAGLWSERFLGFIVRLRRRLDPQKLARRLSPTYLRDAPCRCRRLWAVGSR